MSCCSKSKFVVGAAVLGLGVAALFATGVAPAIWSRAVAKFEKQIPPEVQIEQLKIDIGKLDRDIEKNWTPIAAYKVEVDNLKKELDQKQAKIKTMEKELAAATDELEGKLVKVKYEGREYNRTDAGRLLGRELNYFTALKREVASKEKMLAAREQKLSAALAAQSEMKSQKDELKAQVAQLEADLETLNLIRTEKKLPVGEKNRLDKIKSRMSKLQNDIDVEKKANELRESFNSRSATSETSEKVDPDSVVKRIREELGQNGNVAKDK